MQQYASEQISRRLDSRRTALASQANVITHIHACSHSIDGVIYDGVVTTNTFCGNNWQLSASWWVNSDSITMRRDSSAQHGGEWPA